MSIWRVEVREPAGEGDWELWGRHPSQLEADIQANDYRESHPVGEAQVLEETTDAQAAQLVGARTAIVQKSPPST